MVQKKKSTGQGTGNNDQLRLNKAIAQAGICSRRKADGLIAEGRVMVNNTRVTSPGTKIDPGKDILSVDGAPIPLGRKSAHTYIVLNKPIRTVTTAKDPQGRRTVMDLLPKRMRDRRVFPVGRLDFYSEGLLLLTTDGELTQRMTHPGYNHPKTYEVDVLGTVTQEKLAVIRAGMRLQEGTRLRPVGVEILSRSGKKTRLSMELRQGINRQIRRMCGDLDLKILKLRRVRQGPIGLDGLSPGSFRELSDKEIDRLKQSVQQKRDTPPNG
ncbi:pseudouridine synthase [Desulfoplanes sp.]